MVSQMHGSQNILSKSQIREDKSKPNNFITKNTIISKARVFEKKKIVSVIIKEHVDRKHIRIVFS